MSKQPPSLTPKPKNCPECGQDVTDVDIDVHAKIHWGEVAPDPRKFPEAARRHKALMRLKGGA